MMQVDIYFNFDDVVEFLDTAVVNIFGFLGVICIIAFVGGLILGFFNKGNSGFKTALCGLAGASLCSVLNWAIYGQLLPLPPVLNDIIRALLGI